MTALSTGENFHFTFIVDRSGSMSGAGIASAKDALEIFIRSLPIGCTFSIISFGSRHEWMALQDRAEKLMAGNAENLRAGNGKVISKKVKRIPYTQEMQD